MWVSHPSCKDIILETWKSKVIGCPMFILQKKLQILKSKLKEWNHSTFGNVHDTVKDTEDNLKNIQDQIAVNGNSDSLNTLEREAQAKLNSVLQMEEVFWKEKARVRWNIDGDRNTRFFHRIAKIKQTTKRISSLRVNGDILTDREKIANHVVSYYKDLFNKSSVLQEDNSIEEFIPSLMSDDTNNVLTMFPSYEKVHNVVLSLNIKDGVVNALLQFFIEGWIMPNYNTNLLVLIPKGPNVDSIEQYRPIALANFKHKIVTKIMDDKLSKILPLIISPEQRAFIKEIKYERLNEFTITTIVFAILWKTINEVCMIMKKKPKVNVRI